MTRPLNIVITPVRNEAWVLRAFLEATSLWADYIIIADQMSVDGSREIAKEYPKVILIDNDSAEMHQAATRRLLFEAAKRLKATRFCLPSMPMSSFQVILSIPMTGKKL